MRVTNCLRISYFLSAYLDILRSTLSGACMTATLGNDFCINATKILSLSGSPNMLSSFLLTTATTLPSGDDGCQESTMADK